MNPLEKSTLPDGLTSLDAERLLAEGKSNTTKEKAGKSYFGIIASNLFTVFNLIWAILAAVVIICGKPENLTFLIVVTFNTVIAIVQEIKAKITVEKLSVTTDPKATVVRDGKLVEISAEEIVLGDTVLIEMGK